MINVKTVKTLLDELDDCNFFQLQRLCILSSDLAPLIHYGSKITIDLNYTDYDGLMLVAVSNQLHLMRLKKQDTFLQFTDCLTGEIHNYNEDDCLALPVIIIGKVFSISF